MKRNVFPLIAIVVAMTALFVSCSKQEHEDNFQEDFLQNKNYEWYKSLPDGSSASSSEINSSWINDNTHTPFHYDSLIHSMEIRFQGNRELLKVVSLQKKCK